MNADGWTFHGGRLSAAKAAYRDAPGPWLDLSTGINPHRWPGAAGATIDWAALPDEVALRDLEAAAARYFEVDPDHLCAVPGTEIGLRLLGTMIAGPLAHVGPGYRTHADIAPAATPATEASILLANPNNPDGRLFDRHKLLAMTRPPHWLIVDEAFADVEPRWSIADRIGDAQRLIIFRSFGKFFGLAGVRLGFVLGQRPMIARYRARLGSWPVSAAALAIGAAAYRDAAWIDEMRTRLRADAAALDVVLAGHGLVATGACPLFRLIATDDAATLFDRLARQAILTRPFDHDPRWLRIGLPGSAEALERLDRALADG